MLDDPSIVVESEEIHRYVLFVSRPRLVRVERYRIPLSHRSHKIDVLVGVLPGHFIEVFDEGRLAVSNQWIVLYVLSSSIQLVGFQTT